jgi:hypothetical protein
MRAIVINQSGRVPVNRFAETLDRTKLSIAIARFVFIDGFFVLIDVPAGIQTEKSAYDPS